MGGGGGTLLKEQAARTLSFSVCSSTGVNVCEDEEHRPDLPLLLLTVSNQKLNGRKPGSKARASSLVPRPFPPLVFD